MSPEQTPGAGDAAIFVAPGPRTPFAKIDGPLAHLDAVALSVPLARHAARAATPDLVVWGTVIPSLSVANIAREVWLDAGLDPRVPALTVVQQCATSLAGATHAAAQARKGVIDLALCGGSEAMSAAQVGLSPGLSRTLRRVAQARGPAAALRALGGLRLRHVRLGIPTAKERTTGLSMGEHAEVMAKEWNIARDRQDRLALDSHTRAVRAWESGFFDDLVIQAEEYAGLGRDTIPRGETSLEKLASLPPAFDRDSGRGTLTAGNSSPLTDGAAACWVGTTAGLERLGHVSYRARLVDWETAAVDIERDGLLMAPALAIPRLLARRGLTYDDIDLWEIHEAFAAQVLCTIDALDSRQWLRERAGVDVELGSFPNDRINPNGGSVAVGHPFGATGARILSQTVKELARAGGRALISICAAGGLGHVALLESI